MHQIGLAASADIPKAVFTRPRPKLDVRRPQRLEGRFRNGRDRDRGIGPVLTVHREHAHGVTLIVTETKVKSYQRDRRRHVRDAHREIKKNRGP
jgi:hypothetical protein